jgi:uncharacterized lipoprotein YehR (DUF1307 family)
MSDAAYKELIGYIDEYIEYDDSEEQDVLEEIGIYNYARIMIEDAIATYDFKNIYINLLPDIMAQEFQLRRVFCQKMLDKIFEIYDFQFPETVYITTDAAIARVLEFIQFLEYDNDLFLSLVWEMLKVDIMKVDIETMCKRKGNIIINEVEEQLQSHHQGELITIFLRTYYKEKFIEWFIRESKRSKVFIKLEILEREGKLNA